MSGARRGRVVLVGAGPGAPDLLTLRGERALRRADVVVHDALVSPSLLSLAPPSAERIDVGRRGHAEPPRSQAEIHALLVERARAGQYVVRLKGGDPYVFGRGGEEASACRAAGVAFEVVPGVSAAIAALAHAGIPVTDRRHAASFAVVTGHKDPTRVREQIRWRELATGVDTLVILMGMRALPELVSRLLAAGRAPDTPAAVVMEGTRPGQRVVAAPLAELPQRAAAAGLHAPAAIVVGDVVRLRAELGWFEEEPLFGRRVLVTRAAEQAGTLCRALEAAGAEPVPVPTLCIVPAPASPALDAALRELPHYDFVIFTSANAVRALAAAAERAGHAPRGLALRALCVGPATAQAAAAAGFSVEPVSEAGDAAALAAAVGPRVARARVLWPRAAAAGPALAEALRAAGAELDDVVVYRSAPAPFDGAALAAELSAGTLHALTFASPSAARSFAEGMGEEGMRVARRAVVGAIGRVTAAALDALGLPAAAVAERPEPEALVEALANAFAARERNP